MESLTLEPPLSVTCVGLSACRSAATMKHRLTSYFQPARRPPPNPLVMRFSGMETPYSGQVMEAFPNPEVIQITGCPWAVPSHGRVSVDSGQSRAGASRASLQRTGLLTLGVQQVSLDPDSEHPRCLPGFILVLPLILFCKPSRGLPSFHPLGTGVQPCCNHLLSVCCMPALV